jgi:2-oxoglutarate ferredoxin oxidoreductase subunit gamma
MYHDLFIAGTGGQGILLIGNIIAEAALAEGREVTFLPSYGVEMRGGNANCTVVISDREIGSPSVNTPQTLIIMSARALSLYEAKLIPGGLLILNSSLVPAERVKRHDLRLQAFPLNDLATRLGDTRLANMIALGLYVGATAAVRVESLAEGMEHALSERSRRYIPQNMKASAAGGGLAKKG